MKTLKKLLFLLTPLERKRAVLLLIMILIMAIVDMMVVASILPFMAVLANQVLLKQTLFKIPCTKHQVFLMLKKINSFFLL